MIPPGLPEPRRLVLPVPAGGADAARQAGRRRRRRAVGAVGGVVTGLVVLGSVLPGPGPVDRLQVALDPSNDVEPVPADRITGRVTDVAGRPLSRIAVLPSDLSSVLTRTDADGRFDVACGSDLVLAAYAPAPRDGVVRERSPGVADVAWRRLRGRCGQRLDVSLPAGGVVEGTGRPGEDVRLERVRASSTDVPAEGPVFATRTAADGRWRVEGLDTGRYRVAGTEVFVDVREGRTTRVEP